MSCYIDALNMLSRRSLTVAECRTRLADRDHSEADIDDAINRLLETRALDDGRLAREFARTASEVKGRGRLRVVRELQNRGVPKDVASAAVADVFGEKDERSLVKRAVQKKLRGKPAPEDRPGLARLYKNMMRQGFTPGVVSAVLRSMRGSRGPESDVDEEVR